MFGRINIKGCRHYTQSLLFFFFLYTTYNVSTFDWGELVILSHYKKQWPKTHCIHYNTIKSVDVLL